MLKLERLLENLEKQKATELLIAPFTQPRFRSQLGWEVLTPELQEAGEVREMIWNFLSEMQREKLAEKGAVTGSVGLPSGVNLNFSILRHKLGYSGLIKIIKNEILDNERQIYQPVLLEQSLKSRGLILISGPAKSGRSTFLSHLVDRRNQEVSSYMTVLESSVQFIHHPQKSVINQLEVTAHSDLQDLSQIADSDAIFIDVLNGVELLTTALNFVEAGKLVVLTLNVDSFAALIRRLESEFSANNRQALFERLAAALLIYINCRLLGGVSADTVVAQEVFIFNSVMREHLKKGDLLAIEKYVAELGDKVGMRTLNQVLTALSVRRKVDLKQAFLASYDPEGLDQLFSKMGV